jgi:hypothetical protein|tara:strand:- start:2383 stop:2547 length:165 start_codon:yes stop_codon:yes gene_type:complete
MAYNNARNARMKKKAGKFSLTVRKGSRIWKMVRKFKSRASRDRAKRGLAEIGWR